MAIVTGSLRTFFRKDLTGRAPFLRFIPSQVGIKQGFVFAEAHQDVTPEISSGFFSVDMEETPPLGPDAHYTMQLWYLQDPNTPPGQTQNWACVDFPDVKIYVPAGGGDIGDLSNAPLRPGEVWVSPGGSEPAGSKPGDLIFDPLSDDLFVIN